MEDSVDLLRWNLRILCPANTMSIVVNIQPFDKYDVSASTLQRRKRKKERKKEG